jgi:Holliday junction resolvase
MSRVLAALLVIAGATTTIAQKAPEVINLTGKWLMTLEMAVGTSSPVLVLKQDAEKLTGTYTGRYGEFQLVGKVEGRKVEFVVTINAEGTETKMSFAGELTTTPTGDELRGGAELGGMGEASWLAKRDKK